MPTAMAAAWSVETPLCRRFGNCKPGQCLSYRTLLRRTNKAAVISRIALGAWASTILARSRTLGFSPEERDNSSSTTPSLAPTLRSGSIGAYPAICSGRPLNILAQLSPFCPCQLSENKPEHELLTNLFFGKLNDDETSRVRRRKSLALILEMTRAIASGPEATLDPWTFRSCCYCASLPAGAAWKVPEAQESIRDEWRLYEINEFLSVACQALLTIFIRSLELLPSPPSGAAIVVHYLLGDKTLKPLSRTPWVKYLAERRKVLPAIDNASNSNHELKLMEALFDLDTGEGSLADLGRGVKLVLEV